MVLLNTEHMKGLLVALSFLAVVMGIVCRDAAKRCCRVDRKFKREA